MDLPRTFENRSGRVIALFRAILALIFLSAVYMAPGPPSAGITEGRIVLAGYAAMSFGLIAVAWRSWWYDELLAPVLLALDVAVFVGLVFLTETANTDFTSPFLAMFALIVLSATLRWDWRIASRAGLAGALLFVLCGLLVWRAGMPIDVMRSARRVLYMLALLLVLVWFGIQRREPQAPPLDGVADEEGNQTLRWRALEYAMAATEARTGVLAWSDSEEPWVEVCEARPSGRSTRRLAPDAMPEWDEAAAEVRLFDLPRRRKLVGDGTGGPRTRALHTPLPLAERAHISEGLTLPIHCVSGSGLIVLGGIPGPGADFLALGRILAREIGSAFDRTAIAQLERDALVARTRSAIARDLHDSVAQSLAGACFRLEALRRSADASGALATSIAEIRDALRLEQAHVRGLIAGLRSPAAAAERRDLRTDVQAGLTDAAAHWAVRVTLEAAGSMAVPRWLSHELQQLVREAVANAARHGGAERVTVTLEPRDRHIGLVIADDGRGFDSAALPQQPWSIHERVAALGGRLVVESGPAGTRLVISLPAGTLGVGA